MGQLPQPAPVADYVFSGHWGLSGGAGARVGRHRQDAKSQRTRVAVPGSRQGRQPPGTEETGAKTGATREQEGGEYKGLVDKGWDSCSIYLFFIHLLMYF